jgi:hypothetical protein
MHTLQNIRVLLTFVLVFIFFGIALQGEDIVFRFIIDYNSLTNFVVINILKEFGLFYKIYFF